MHDRGFHTLRTVFAILGAGWACLGVPAPVVGDEPPAVAVFADGAEVRGPVSDIADPAKAAVAKRPLFAAGKQVRWVRIGKPGAVTPDAFVEFDNGDRLPGTVIGHDPEGLAWETRPAAAQPMNHPTSHPAMLTMAGTGDASAGATRVGKYRTVAETGLVRVRRDRVRRVVWRRTVDRRYRPRTLFLTDGGAVAFRSLRWTDEGVIALLEDGTTERHGFEAIAELHLAPRAEPWDSWFESLVDDSGVVQAETRVGIRVTTPRSRWRPAQGTPVPMIMTQPSWSLQPLFLAVSAVSEVAVFDLTEAPLSALEPSRVTQRSPFGASWTWQIDRNVQGGPLDLAGLPAGWGFGVQARTELAFPLCDGVRGFRGRVGLDRAAGTGGCVRAALHANDVGTPALWTSELLVGSGTWADCATVALTGPASGQKALVLVADDAHRDRPAGADPFDIRDVVDWCDPLLELDAAAVRSQVAARLPFVVPAWTGWTATPAAAGTVKSVPAIDPIVVSERAGWAAATVAEGGPLRLTREWAALRPQDRHMVIAVSAVGKATGAIELLLDGRRWELPLPARSDKLPAVPFVLPLAGRAEGPLAVEIVVPAGLAVHWHALGLTGDIDGGWFPLEPIKMESSAGSTFKTRDDGAILVSLPSPQGDDYTLRLASKQGGIRAVRIDALTDPSLPKPAFGPGRGPGARSCVSGLTLAAATGEELQPLTIIAAYSDPVLTPYGPIEAVLRRGQSASWWQSPPAVPTRAVFHWRQGDGDGPEEVVLRMEFRVSQSGRVIESLGCFRVYGSTDPTASLPVTDATWLVRQADEPGALARRTIVAVPAEQGAGP
jgi:hypothetical protein